MNTGHPAPPEAVGRICPYCRVALEDGANVVFCTSCGAVHHDDCWEENGGCAVALCAGGPSLRDDDEDGAEAATVAAPLPPPPPAPALPLGPVQLVPAEEPPSPPPPATPVPSAAAAPPPPPGPPLPGQERSRRNWIPLIAVAIVLLGGATAGAIVVSGNSKSSSTTVETAAATAPESEFSESEEEPFGSEEEGAEEEEFEPEPELTASQLARREVQQSLRAHFNNLAEDRYDAAYRGLTPTEGEEIGGESSWVAAQGEDQLQSFDLRVNTALLSSHSARARIAEFQTRSLATGCKQWTGYWEMSKVYGEWLISAATLESEPC